MNNGQRKLDKYYILKDDYRYQYTECDNDNHRWKVAIPNGTCVGNVPQPVRATDCNFSCKEGTYLDLRSQTCQECPSGTYSLGGGYIFEDFVSVPDEFSVTNERIGNQYYTESNDMFVDPSDNCDKYSDEINELCYYISVFS